MDGIELECSYKTPSKMNKNVSDMFLKGISIESSGEEGISQFD
jgi:hypothetical protein